MRYVVGIDVGGTFTDFVLVDERDLATGRTSRRARRATRPRGCSTGWARSPALLSSSAAEFLARAST